MERKYMEQGKLIACVGAAIVDCIVKGFDPEPISATGYFAESADLAPGGEAVNQAVTLSKLGLRSRIVCFTGKDTAGGILLGELERHGVDTGFVRQRADARTPVTVMFVDATGDRRSITNTAHRLNFHPEADFGWMEGAAAVSLCSLFRAPFNEPEIVNKVAAEAKRRGLPVYADTKLPNARRLTLADLRDSLPLMDCLFPNEKEGAFYTGETEPEAMADVFLSYGLRSVIVKLGPEGCLYKDPTQTLRLPGLPVHALDATGAGDNFAAGFIAMRAEGKTAAEALRFANTCGALSTTATGATAALQSRKQVLQAMEELTADS